MPKRGKRLRFLAASLFFFHHSSLPAHALKNPIRSGRVALPNPSSNSSILLGRASINLQVHAHYKDKFDRIPEAVLIHFLVTPGDPIVIHIDEHLLDYGKILIESVLEKTISEDKRDYPCTCGGYCERDLK